MNILLPLPIPSNLEYKETILAFYSKLSRKEDQKALSTQLLALLTNKYVHYQIPETNTTYLTILYQMIGQTRDIVNGKGEYTLTYMQLYTWYQVYPELAKQALESILETYGSWKDIKYLCAYIKEQEKPKLNSTKYNCHPLILHAVKIANRQLWLDSTKPLKTKQPDIDLSLVAKWIPREGSKFGWLFPILAQDYFEPYYTNAKTEEAQKRADRKAKMNYRKLIANLNRRLNTVQIKQCANEWDTIDHSNATSITIQKQWNAFFNRKANGKQRTIKDDRVQCANNFRQFIYSPSSKDQTSSVVPVNTCEGIKQIMRTLPPYYLDKVKLITNQTNNNRKIVMVDVSSSMDGPALYAALALGTHIADTSLFGKQVMTFEPNSRWVTLWSNTVSGKVEELLCAPWGGSIDFYQAFDLILKTIIEKRLSPKEVEGLVFIILTDMPIKQCQPYHYTSFRHLVPMIEKLYVKEGLRTVGKPYPIPHLLYWNIKETNEFPSIDFNSNITIVSGFSPILVDEFICNGMDALYQYSPWNQLVKTLQTPQYQPLGDVMNRTFPMI